MYVDSLAKIVNSKPTQHTSLVQWTPPITTWLQLEPTRAKLVLPLSDEQQNNIINFFMPTSI